MEIIKEQAQKIMFFDKTHKNIPLYLQVLMAEELITAEQLKPYTKTIKSDNLALEQYLISVVGKEKLLDALSKDYEVGGIDLDKMDVSARTGMVIPPEIAISGLAACVGVDERGIHLAMVNPRDDYVISQIESAIDFNVVERFVVLYSDLSRFHDALYGVSGPQNVSVRDLVDNIIRSALEQEASDIHIEPYEDDIKVRFRKDGMLIEAYDICKTVLEGVPQKKFVIQHLKKSIPAVIKNKSGTSGRTMDNFETAKCQDGRIFLPTRNIEMRVSVLPSVHGESIAIRILNPERGNVSFLDLGFSAKEKERFETVINSPYGIILISGPTGSGKTTTLYTVLKSLNDPTRKILTVEDPVEYTISGIVQIQTNMAKELSFATALRSFMRHDPDIIMVGEIRDRETASMAVEASLTGHLVLSTIHANDAVRTITRLKDLAVNPLLITSTCLGTMAQRLVRVNCPHCRESAKFSSKFLKLLESFKIDYDVNSFIKSKGCKICNGMGYLGRMGIYELMLMTPAMKELILREAPDMEMEKLARDQGMQLLIEDALHKVTRGITTEEEVLRVTLSDHIFDEKEQEILNMIEERPVTAAKAVPETTATEPEKPRKRAPRASSKKKE